MDFLYADADACNFMDPETYDQVAIPPSVVGEAARFLQPQMSIAVEFVAGSPVGVVFPDVLEVRIADTAPPLHNQQDSAWKSISM
jgi:elongation factor P